MYGVGGGSSDAISRDMNSLLYSSTFKHPADGEFAKIKQLISSEPYPNYANQNRSQNQNQNQNQNQSQSQNQNQHPRGEIHGENQSSLLRFRSSSGSFFSNLLGENGDGEEFRDSVNASSNHEQEERFFMRQQQQQKKSESESDARDFLRYASSSSTATNQERNESVIQPPTTAATRGGSSSRRVSDLPPSNNSGYNYTSQSNLNSASSFGAMDSSTSNLVRQSSSPAGFLSTLTVENGFAGMKDGRKGSSSRISFSLGPSSSSRFLPQIAEEGSELHDSTFSSLKRTRDGGLKMSLDGETGNRIPGLVSHMSLPKTSSEMAAAETFLHFQQEPTVHWKTRAKRGFATHPRSIAERVRRTRISERIKRLQELFPDIDKQTNTADMLDMAVEYIKNLQKGVQTLTDARARCKCLSKQLDLGSVRYQD